ncbi:MAG: asparagine--tRNA ligase [Candidatus Cloacimonetes bacterium]|nr:asparagine--tRNA ligase [Candidatus Cloacimonadota bacterium]MCF7814927.1 asparagine--tRNA ligase [Candidatus Cloacimonadota bacterium]MCF7868147.1 asparagine--tRNA ligase [Candidatus Cloacimonadota bacterium]MCF7883613.1 asparagine--tRNA ligase [Candidatus Cloacimonadota bacterium]
MKTIEVKDLKDHLEKEVKLRGWVRNYRKASSKLRFVIFRDGSADVQCVAFKPEMGVENFEKVKALTIESSLEIIGIPQKHPKREGVIEFHLKDINIIDIADEYPIGKKEHGPDFLLSQRHLWMRSAKQNAALKIRHTVYFAICEYLNNNGFYRFDSPILTPNASEGTTTLFEVPYFDLGSAFLSQSGQLYLEAGIMSLGRVYDFGPVFRAEKSKTRKHLTEFWMMDAEAAFVEHDENLQIQEELIRYVIRTVIDRNSRELEILERDVEQLKKADAPFKRMTHREVIDFLKSKGVEIDYLSDFGAPEEELITAGSDVPVFVEKWPKEIKSFYMKRDPENPDIALGADLIAPEGFGEIIGGSQREDDHELLLERINKEGYSIEDYQWFLDLRKYGSVPHSGFGIGLERLVQWMSGVRHIREVIPFPRMINRIYP